MMERHSGRGREALVYLCLMAALAYPVRVITCLRRASILLRASLLALLVLGIVIKPILASAFELHTADHALSVQDNDPDHDPSEGVDHDLPGIDGERGQDHTQGVHGLLHEGKCGGAYSDTVVALSLPLAPYQATLIPLPVISPVSLQHIAGPFRPPIS